MSGLTGYKNGYITLTYGKNTSYNDRQDTITIVCGNLSRNIFVNQSGIMTIVSVKGMIGNMMTNRADSVYIQFSRPVKSMQITSNWQLCLSDIKVSPFEADNSVKFSYNCADLGGNYPFTIRFEDFRGIWFTEEISVPFYKAKLEVNGYMNSFILINDQKEALIPMINPDKLIRYSIEKDSVMKVYDLSDRISPKNLVYDPYRSKVYIIGSKPGTTYIYTDYTEPLQVLDLKTDKIEKGFEIPDDPTDHAQHPTNVPYNMAIRKSVRAVVFLKSPAISSLKPGLFIRNK